MSVIAQWISWISTLIAFLAILVAFWKKLKKIGEGQQCQLRSDITGIYYKHCDEENPMLREFERKNLDALTEAYKALGGNNYIDDLYDQMRHWKVKK